MATCRPHRVSRELQALCSSFCSRIASRLGQWSFPSSMGSLQPLSWAQSLSHPARGFPSFGEVKTRHSKIQNKRDRSLTPSCAAIGRSFGLSRNIPSLMRRFPEGRRWKSQCRGLGVRLCHRRPAQARCLGTANQSKRRIRPSRSDFCATRRRKRDPCIRLRAVAAGCCARIGGRLHRASRCRH
jgi:hypothetical protein